LRFQIQKRGEHRLEVQAGFTEVGPDKVIGSKSGSGPTEPAASASRS
jgi:hypothetical protein